MPLPMVAIVGRPNVGKSALFNRFLGERRAIVDPMAGLTRDRLYAEVEWRGRRFIIVDTAGLVLGKDRDDGLADETHGVVGQHGPQHRLVHERHHGRRGRHVQIGERVASEGCSGSRRSNSMVRPLSNAFANKKPPSGISSSV